MKKFFLVSTAILCLTVAHGQTTFEKKYTPSIQQYGREIFQTADSGFLLQGTIEQAWRNCYLIKTDSIGDTLWTKKYGTDSIQFYCYDMAKTPDGGYVMCGDYQTVLTYPSMDSYIQKIDSNGNQVWFNLFGWTATQGGDKDHGQLVKVLKDSSIIVEGMTKDIYYSIGNYQWVGFSWNSYLAKLNNTTGNLSDIITVCDKIDTSCFNVKYWSLDVETINNKIYWLGIPFYTSSSTYGDTTLAVFDSNLDTVFTIRSGLGKYYALSKTSDKHLLLFANGITTKMDTLGNVVWTTTNSSPSLPYEVKEISNGNFISIGGDYFVRLVDADFFGINNQVVYINKYSPTGILTWSKAFNLPSGINYQLGYNIVETYDKGFAFVGFSDYNIWLVKTDSLGNLNTSIIETNPNKNSIVVFPNPFYSQTTLQTYYLLNNATLTVYNSFGQTVKQIKNISGQTITLHRDNLPSGLYFLRLTENNKTLAVDKLIITD